MKALFTGLLGIVLLAGVARAETAIEVADYLMGDNDTRQATIDACVVKAERMALENFGTVVDSDLSILRSDSAGVFKEKSSSQIRGFVAGIVRGKVLHGGWDMDMRYTCTVQVDFDPDEVHKLLERVATTHQERVVSTASGQSAIEHVKDLTRRAKTILVGMTNHEVILVMGEKPRATDESRWQDIVWWNYGSVWIALHHNPDDGWTVDCLAPVANTRACGDAIAERR